MKQQYKNKRNQVGEVVRTLASSPCYGPHVVPKVVVHQEDEADQLEKAVDSTFASAPRQLTAPEGPLGMEVAFDQLFPPDSDAQGVQESSSDSNDEGSADFLNVLINHSN